MAWAGPAADLQWLRQARLRGTERRDGPPPHPKGVRHARRGCCSRYGAERAPLPPGPAGGPGGPARSPAAAAAWTPALRPAAAPCRSDRGALPAAVVLHRRLGPARGAPTFRPLCRSIRPGSAAAAAGRAMGAGREKAGGPWAPRMRPPPSCAAPCRPCCARSPRAPAARRCGAPPALPLPAGQPAGSMWAEARRGPPTAPPPSPSCPAAPRRPFPPRTALSSARR